MIQVKITPDRGITARGIRRKSECHKLHLSNSANKRNFNWSELTLNWTLEQCLISWLNRQTLALGAQPYGQRAFGCSASRTPPLINISA